MTAPLDTLEEQLEPVQNEDAKLPYPPGGPAKGHKEATPANPATLDVADFEGPEEDTLGCEEPEVTDDEKGEDEKSTPMTGWNTKRFEDFVRKAEYLKSIGNKAFRHACECADESFARATAEVAAIYYLDAIDLVENTPATNMTQEQAATRSRLLLTLQLNRSAALNKHGEWRLSLSAAGAALDIDSNNIKALYRRGVALTGLFAYAEAEADFNAVLRIDPTNRDAKLRLVEISRKFKSHEKRKLDNLTDHSSDSNSSPLR